MSDSKAFNSFWGIKDAIPETTMPTPLDMWDGRTHDPDIPLEERKEIESRILDAQKQAEMRVAERERNFFGLGA